MPADPTVDLAALDALYQAATPGPWEQDPDLECYVCCVVKGRRDSRLLRTEDSPEDAALIAAAVTALPDLLRRVRLGDAAREVCDLTADLRSLWKAMGAGIDGAAEAYSQRLKAIVAARARYRALLETPDAGV